MPRKKLLGFDHQKPTFPAHNRVCYFSFLFVRLNQSSLTKAPSQRYLKNKNSIPTF